MREKTKFKFNNRQRFANFVPNMYVLSNLDNIILHMPELIIKITEIRLERSLYMQFVNKLAFSALISDLWKFFVCAYYAYDPPNRLKQTVINFV